MRKNRGSLTVEATISMVFFLSIMIIFLLFMKILVIENALQTTAKEAAKRVASHSYYFKVVENQMGFVDPEDEKAYEETEWGMEIGEYTIKNVGGKALGIFAGNAFKKDSASKLTAWKKGGIETGVDAVLSLGGLFVGDLLEPGYFNSKRTMQQNIVVSAISEADGLSNLVDPNKIILEYVKYPEGSYLYKKNLKNEIYDKISLDADSYIKADDVVVVLSYPISLDIPFFGKQKLVVTKTAVEHPWLNGGNGIMARNEGLLSKLVKETTNIATYGFVTVKITNNGNYYHEADCSALVGEYATDIRKYNAIKLGFKACSSCSP